MANSGTTRVSVTHQPFLNFFMRMKTTRADLDLDLDKGNVLYKEARKRFPDHSHLTTDELPDKVHTRGHRLHVDMKILSKYGTFGEPLPGTVDDFLDLEAGLTCLLTEVQYALLMMRSLCIAVFSTMSGRCSFFDPHSRTAKSLPVSLGLVMPGTAVMLIFPHLSDMTDKLMKQHKMMATHSSYIYELKPVEFYSVNTTNLNNAIPDTPTSQSAAPTTAVLDDALQKESSLSAPRFTTVVTVVSNNTVHDACTDMETETEPLSQFTLNSDTSHDAPQNE